MSKGESAVSHPHLLCDLWFTDREILKFVEPLKGHVLDAARAGQATIYKDHWHQFEPFGVTGFLLLMESHISVHTWVEEGFLALDIFPCGVMNVDAILEELKVKLEPARVRTLLVDRGRAESEMTSVDSGAR